MVNNFLAQPRSLQKNIKHVFLQKLCTGCGACAGVCPQESITLSLNRDLGLTEPNVDSETCVSCGICLQVCPGLKCDLDELRPKNHEMILQGLGGVSKTYAACSTDSKIRYDGSSGGMVTATLLYLLERKMIHAAVITRMKKNTPFEAEAFMARERDELIAAQGSKYCPVSNCSLFKEIERSNERYAFVGLPCQIAALRKAQRLNEKLVEKVPYTLGLFCSRTPNSHATRFLIDNVGINREKVQRIKYRGEGHPGRFEVALLDGSIEKINHLDNRYWGFTFLHFFKPFRCWLCNDHSAELSDWSFADNWSKKVLDRKYKNGISIVVARTKKSSQITGSMRDSGFIKAEEISAASVIQQQKLIEKTNISPRLWIWGKTGKMVPELNPVPKNRNKQTDIIKATVEFFHIHLSNRQYNYIFLSRYIWISRSLFTLLEKFKSLHKLMRKMKQIFSIKKGVSHNLKKKCKILIIGGFGYHDIGDEAMPRADIINLRSRIEDLEIVMASPDVDYTKSYHCERSIQDITDVSCGRNSSRQKRISAGFLRCVFLFGCFLEKYNLRLGLWPSARCFLDELSNSDILFNVGGGNLTSVIPFELYKKGTIYLGARILGKKIILSGQTIGPFTRFADKIWSRLCLSCVDLITMRDKNLSCKRVEEIGVTRPIVFDAADDAMTLPEMSAEDAEKLLKQNVSEEWYNTSSSFFVIMNLKASLLQYKDDVKRGLNREVSLMAKIAEKLITNFNAKILFLPTDYHNVSDDRLMHREIISLMKDTRNCECIENEYDDIHLKGLISTADVAIGSRYHFCVFAASRMIPFLGMASGIYQKTKLKGLSDLACVPDCYVPEDMETADFEMIWEFVENIFKNREEIKLILSKNVPELKKQSLLAVDYATEVLKLKSKNNNFYRQTPNEITVTYD